MYLNGVAQGGGTVGTTVPDGVAELDAVATVDVAGLEVVVDDGGFAGQAGALATTLAANASVERATNALTC